MKYTRIVLLIVFLAMGSTISANAACTDVKGTWRYQNATTGEIKKILFKITGGGKIDAQIYEKCSSGTCDQGEHACSVRFSDCTLWTNYTNGVEKHDLTMNMTNVSTLQVKVKTHFTDNSSSDTEKTYTFRRLVVQSAPDPKPMDRVTPKPMERVNPTPVTNEPTGKY